MKNSTHLLIMGLAVLGFQIRALAQGEITGKVTTKNGDPVEYATVSIPKSSLGVLTDSAGNYSLLKVKAGKYAIKASFTGYGEQVKEVEVTDGGTSVVNFEINDESKLDEVVVTGTVNPQSTLESSLSLNTLKATEIAALGARTTAELFRSLPGIKSESSGGDGNTNISVRGIPIATGGSKFLQLHEDGLPVMQFGDIAFVTADIFLRADNTVSRIEALRGGSASVLASNSPAGIINFISKDGSKEGGSLAQTVGLTFQNYRTDFEYGTSIGKGLSFHIGGFYRQGDGPRPTHFTSSNGGQLKANITKRFAKGYTRFYFKFLNDRTPAYMPMPMQVTGTDANPTWGSVNGYDALFGTMQSPDLLSNIGTGPDGNLRRSNVANGMNPISVALGNEFSFDLGNGWSILNKGRFAMNSGQFIAPFPAEVGSISSIANAIGGPTARATYANSGIAVPDNANGNGLLMRMHLFDTQLNNLNNFTNDFNVSKSVGMFKANVGLYKAYQSIAMSWLWNTYITDVNSGGLKRVDIANAAGDTTFTNNGLLAYGTPAWGGLHRNYDLNYDITAPYANVEFKPMDKLTFEAGVRYDYGKVYGTYASNKTKALDMNGDGLISIPEQKVNVIDNTKPSLVNYDYSYLSYSLGANFLINDRMSVFGRYSYGGRSNADRLIFTPYILPDGSAKSGLKADMVTQAEAGYKLRTGKFTLNATGFFVELREQNNEPTRQVIINREYRSYGLELDGSITLNNFNLRGSATFTNSKIIKDEITPTNVGHTPRRQAAVIYNFSPSYNYKKHSVGLTFIGTTQSYAQDDNKLVMPAYTYVNAFVNIGITDKLSLSFNGNNLFNQLGITETENNSITANTTNIVRARSIPGRTITTTLKFTF